MSELEKVTLDALTRKMSELYVSYRKQYVLSKPDGSIFIPKRKGDVPCVLTDRVLFNHLCQKYAIAVFAGPRTSKFLCFDVDDGSADTVQAIIGCLTKFGFPKERIYVSFSGGKGYHVEMFFNRLVYTNRLYALYSTVISQSHLDPRKVEFRPLPGNAIKLPLSIHGKTGNVCWFVDQKT
ncbi:TOTE conflict system archaeo-eukaryotic primase domain-containing protein [Butyricicoccus sp.]|jgi:hypothetical protein|uniref:TOTE conflict system archaeo-eukaryotic primase domain-containing protein n=1 Tax=Butyricicoccus sp. TaxID=2049021 RepID=UPI003AAB794C